MLTGNEPISAGNLKAALGSMAAKMASTVVATGLKKFSISPDESVIALRKTSGGGADFTVADGTVKLLTDGVYSIDVHASYTNLEDRDGLCNIDLLINGAPVPVVYSGKNVAFAAKGSASVVACLEKGNTISVNTYGYRGKASVSVFASKYR